MDSVGGAEVAAFTAAGVALIVGLVNPIYQAKQADSRQRAQLRHERLSDRVRKPWTSLLVLLHGEALPYKKLTATVASV
jgi:hypothetical protein